MNVAFYSYKGGVGRTQLVANLARYLYLYENKKVLLMDWDLEAPGLHYYFKKTNEDFKGEGLIDLLEKYVQLVKNNNPAEITEAQLPKFEAKHITKTDCFNETTGAKIDIIAAGAYADFPTYRKKIIDFNWKEFYEFLDGARYLEYTIKPNLKELGYDFVFIDSRTGISDYQNICNIQLVDANMIVIAPNMQNLEGCMEVAKSIVESPYVKEGNRKPIVFPILSRVDIYADDYPIFENTYKEKCQFLIDNLNELNKNNDPFIPFRMNINEYVKNTRLPYNIRIAIGEKQLFNESHNPLLLGEFHQQFQNIANYLLQPSKKVFILYNHKDSDIVKVLSAYFTKLGLNIIIDINSIQAGMSILDFISQSTQQADVVIKIFSEDSIVNQAMLLISENLLQQINSYEKEKTIYCFTKEISITSDFNAKISGEIDEKVSLLISGLEKRAKDNLSSEELQKQLEALNLIKQKLPQFINTIINTNAFVLGDNLQERALKLAKFIKETV
jgi:MinD-like ATPase involved in chromosome partitioning or flagellar assembly